MPKTSDFLTAQEFAQKANVSAGTVSKWLHDGTIIGKKNRGKWSISPAELAKINSSVTIAKPEVSASVPHSNPKPASAGAPVKSYSIKEFSDMTYLTEFGVQKWLKEGRLKKVMAADGQIRVDGASIENPHIKRLLR